MTRGLRRMQEDLDRWFVRGIMQGSVWKVSAILLLAPCTFHYSMRCGHHCSPPVLAIQTRANRAAVVQTFLRLGVDPNILVYESRTMLMFATVREADDVIKVLLDHPRCDVNQKDANGNTALHYACMVSTLESLGLLLDAGASMDDVNADGLKALDIAVLWYNGECVKFLLRRGCNPELQVGQYSYQGGKIWNVPFLRPWGTWLLRMLLLAGSPLHQYLRRLPNSALAARDILANPLTLTQACRVTVRNVLRNNARAAGRRPGIHSDLDLLRGYVPDRLLGYLQLTDPRFQELSHPL